MIRRRKFEPDQNIAFKFSGEHNSALPYSDKYNNRNLNNIRHLLLEQINSYGIWESDLRSDRAIK